MTARVKLDKHSRSHLESINRDRNIAIYKAEELEHFNSVVDMARKRLHAEWGSPEKQADMLVMQKYKHACPVKGSTIDVYNPASKRWDERIGIQYTDETLIPDQGFAHYAGEVYATYFDFHVGQNDADYAVFWAAIEWRRTRLNEITAANKAFAEAIRATNSYAKIIAQYPWLDTDEHRPYFARAPYIAAMQGEAA